MSDKASKFKGLIWIVAALALSAGLARGLPLLVQSIPWSFEEKLARRFNSDEVDSCESSKQGVKAFDTLVARLYPLDESDREISIHVRVVSSDQVNAYAQLGGHIVVFDELIKQAKTPEELAGVLAHEIEHVKRRHVLEGVANKIVLWSLDASQFLNLAFSRDQESAADLGALTRLQKAEIDNSGFKNFFDRMDDGFASAFLSDHPANSARVKMVSEFPNGKTRPILSADEWAALKQICPPTKKRAATH